LLWQKFQALRTFWQSSFSLNIMLAISLSHIAYIVWRYKPIHTFFRLLS
jgi:hypothetical protein